MGINLLGTSKTAVSAHTPHYLSLVHHCMKSIVPKIGTPPFSLSTVTANPTASAASSSENQNSVSRSRTFKIRFEEPASESAEAEIDSSFFVPGVIPSVTDFGPEKMYLTINSAELCAALLFDDRRYVHYNVLGIDVLSTISSMMIIIIE